MGTTIILHNIRTKSGKIKAVQPVERFRKLLKRQKINFYETETIQALAPFEEIDWVPETKWERHPVSGVLEQVVVIDPETGEPVYIVDQYPPDTPVSIFTYEDNQC